MSFKGWNLDFEGSLESSTFVYALTYSNTKVIWKKLSFKLALHKGINYLECSNMKIITPGHITMSIVWGVRACFDIHLTVFITKPL